MNATAQVEVNHAEQNAEAWYASIVLAVAQLSDTKDGTIEREEVEQTIHESVLSVQVRSDWHSPGEEAVSGEYEILLTTGGPAARIIGELDDNCEPRTAELQHQDWFKPWTRYPAPECDLLKFAQCFYFGE